MDDLQPTTPSHLLDEAMALYSAAEGRAVTLRFIGSLAVQLNCSGHKHLAATLGRRPTGDIDFVGYSKEGRRIEPVFTDVGYSLHPGVRLSQEFGVKRLIYVPSSGGPKVDVFLDDLIMAHTIKLAERLPLSSPTVTSTDLLLSKLQIHEMTRNDLIDLIILLAEHEVSDADPHPAIESDYFTRIMGNDWGFHQTATINLIALLRSLPSFGGIPASVAQTVTIRIEELLRLLERGPKTSRWKLRARLGTRVRWYENVTEVD